ncbi:hypothetical protein [Pontibacter mangrovi]|uniref:hypothetical protein n=1 Tax=Pontibacter mangrovi TaxID=2589816 RepID=UPI0015E3B32B|nr:hypothetical protein [Pontibacter mangrovi]
MCTTCRSNNIENTPYSVNFYEFELALLQRELDLMRDLITSKDQLIEALRANQKK